ncbi:helix-turn-helix domain-containing protein [Nocardia fusca]|uniref:helix-turn-helix domain-containing protein n=1 Tax=Nocardia fusca TaxID=941183 RepID=UPI0007A761A2|nr:helix-turn-helix transcriptional regulator [Nocardia fusca]
MAGALRTARKLLLGREIDQMIRVAGLSQAEAGKLIEVGQSRINSIVAGSGTISAGDLKDLARGLGFADEVYIETLLELRRDNHKRGFWNTGYRRAYIDELRLLVDLEAQADRIRETGAELVPGLLQHPDYIRALHEPFVADLPGDGPTVDEYVQARMARQENLTKRGAPEVHMILSESCLRRTYGSDMVMYAQILHLIELSERHSNILLQVMPFTHAVPGAGMEDRHVLIRVPSPGAAGDLEMAVVEAQGELRYIDDKAALAARERVFSRLAATALSESDSRAFMEHIARSLRSRPTVRA